MNVVFIFITTILLSIFNIFNITYKGNEINRIVMNIPLNLLKNSIVIEEITEDDFNAYFLKDEVEKDIKKYLNTSLKGKINEYNLSFFYYKYDSNDILIKDNSNKPINFQLHFHCNYYKNYDLNRYLKFRIEEIWG